MWLLLTLACAEPPVEYTIPENPKSRWTDSPSQLGPPSTVGVGPGPSPEDGQAPSPSGAEKPPIDGAQPSGPEDPLPGEFDGTSPDPGPPKISYRKGDCRPITSSAYLAPKKGGVKISGRITVSVPMEGPLLLELVSVENGKTQPQYSLTCGSALDFTARLPKGLGMVYLVALIDNDGDGPTETDPAVRSDLISLSSDKIIDLELNEGIAIQPVSFPFAPPRLQNPDSILPVPGAELPPPVQVGDPDRAPQPVVEDDKVEENAEVAAEPANDAVKTGNK